MKISLDTDRLEVVEFERIYTHPEWVERGNRLFDGPASEEEAQKYIVPYEAMKALQKQNAIKYEVEELRDNGRKVTGYFVLVPYDVYQSLTKEYHYDKAEGLKKAHAKIAELEAMAAEAKDLKDEDLF